MPSADLLPRFQARTFAPSSMNSTYETWQRELLCSPIQNARIAYVGHSTRWANIAFPVDIFQTLMALDLSLSKLHINPCTVCVAKHNGQHCYLGMREVTGFDFFLGCFDDMMSAVELVKVMVS
jgi:hypothetical protein